MGNFIGKILWCLGTGAVVCISYLVGKENGKDKDFLEVSANAVIAELMTSETVTSEEKKLLEENKVDFKNFVKQDIIDRTGLYDSPMVANAQFNTWLRIKDNESRM